MKNRFNLSFVEDCAIDLNNNEHYDRDSVMESIKNEIINVKNSTIRRVIDEKGKFITYIFESNSDRVKIIVTKEYRNNNVKYLKELDEIYVKDKKTKRTKIGLKYLGLVTAFSAGVALSGPVCSAFDNAKGIVVDIVDNPIKDLEFEIELHGVGKIIQTDTTVRPEYDHGCVFEKENKSFLESIEIYCEENGLEHLTEDAVRKYQLYREGKNEEAKEIILKEIDKEYQKSGKNK